MARVLVTGAGSGLGLLTAQSLVEQGHEVVLHARATSRVEDHRLIDQVRDGSSATSPTSRPCAGLLARSTISRRSTW
ncbi:hypothetical protein BW730_01675 [Tessaracoccus aquimaris]|uniref:Uncharacterized protein n=1 Tax=Tessaracoccus aquimaris TaxID=1332264 RepID=A0A1Q2CK28_9ACTN|nr:SDR family NAD(P)-dependent oxidoreductase [Tessaracoccus aquimaris]AQP46454.1 hypothetical protein BW730_01675 [Tessaracoccus aquimaris]